MLKLRSARQQNLLLEFASLKHVQLSGVYVSLTPRDPTLWAGVLFVKKGPYSPAILRFSIAFPPTYPLTSPLLTFTADIFHPLLTPLTTYTHAPGLLDHETASANGEERLPAGGFSLRHGFPHWFGGNARQPALTKGDSQQSAETSSPGRSPDLQTEEPPVDVTIVDVLCYVRSCFEDEQILDSIPFKAVANPGAWYAWRAHRADHSTQASDTKPAEEKITVGETASRRDSQRKQSDGTPNRPRKPSEWNWEGVWEERVKRAVQASLSEGALFGTGTNREDEIRFVNAGEELQRMRSSMHHYLEAVEL